MDRMQQVQSIFEQALALPASQWDAHVASACAHDSSLVEQVMALLRADDDSEAYVSRLAGALVSLVDESLPDDLPHITGYQLAEKLGEGGMGVVYRAQDLKLQRPVAIKFLPAFRARREQEKNRFLQEARAAARLNHRNVCEVFDIGETTDGQLYIVYAFCPGENLGIIIQQGQLTLEQILQILLQLCDALQVAHEHQIFHRDLKPANLIIDDAFNLKLLDFGIAKIQGHDLSQSGQLIGTFAYMAPEQFSGGQVDARTDLWAVGVLLFEMMTGRPPFHGDNPAAIMYQLFHQELPNLPPGCHPAATDINQLLSRLLVRNRDLRLNSATALSQKIQALRDNLQQRQQLHLPIGYGAVASIAENASSTLSEYRKVVVLGLEVRDKALEDGSVQACISQYHGHVYLNTSKKLLAWFSHQELSEAAADSAVDCALALLNLLTTQQRFAAVNTSLVLALAPVLFVANKATGLQEMNGDIASVLDPLLPLAFDQGHLLITSAVCDRLRNPLQRSLLAAEDDTVTPTNLDTELYKAPPQTRQYVLAHPPAKSVFIGREQELQLLLSAWKAAAFLQGRAVLLSADAGMGKSRLIQEFRNRLLDHHSDYHQYQWFNDPAHLDKPFYCLVRGVRQLLEEIPETNDSGSENIPTLLDRLEMGSADNEALLHWWLGEADEAGEDYAGSHSPEALRRRCVAFLNQLMLSLCQQQNCLLVIEDLHWADSATLEWLDQFFNRPLPPGLFLLLSGRPELFTRWRTRNHLMQLPLYPLQPEDSYSLINGLTDKFAVHADLQQKIVQKTAGNPLFIREYVRLLNHAGNEDESNEDVVERIPDTLEEFLLLRVDRLGDAKPLAQLAAVIGTQFNENIVATIVTTTGVQTPGNLSVALSRLADEGVIIASGLHEWTFQHALIREAVYNSLTREDRQQLHAVVADNMQQLRLASSEDIARHYDAANLSGKSIPLWLLAASDAHKCHSVKEVVRLCSKGIQACHQQPEANTEQELALLLLQGPALIALHNYANTAVGSCYRRALMLSQKRRDPQGEFKARMGLWSHLCVRADHPEASQLAQQLVEQAEQQQEPDWQVEAYLAHGTTSLFCGRRQQARHDFELGLNYYTDEMSSRHIRDYGQEPAMAIHTFAALLEEACGNGDQACRHSDKAVAIARASQHPYSLGYALGFAVHVQLRQGHQDKAMTLRAEYQQLCAQQELHVFQLLGAVQESLLMIATGNLVAGCQALEAAIPPYREFGTGIFISNWYAILSLGYSKLGDRDRAEQFYQLARDNLKKTGEKLCQPLVDNAGQALKPNQNT